MKVTLWYEDGLIRTVDHRQTEEAGKPEGHETCQMEMDLRRQVPHPADGRGRREALREIPEGANSMKLATALLLFSVTAAFGQTTTYTTTPSGRSGSLIVAAGPGPVGLTAGRKAEPLKPDEIAKLAAAQKKVDEAQKALDDVNAAIKTAHGQTNNYGHMMTSSSFCSPYTSVKIWGDYALITTERIESSCVAY